MKKCLACFLALLILVSVGAPAFAETTLYTAYIYYDEEGLPKYWLDFTGCAADNLVLHCFFCTDTWYETYFILDLSGAMENSHQNTYRIENVTDSRGVDVSSWFKTLSLSISNDSASLYVERDPSTLAGGTQSTIFDGLYEMTPATAGVVYEYREDGQLKNWLVLNTANAELHFSDGRVWYLSAENGGEYTANVTRIVSPSGEDLPFQSLTLTYVQGAMLLNADVDEGFSGSFLFNPRVFLQRENCSEQELGRMAQLYYDRHKGYYPPVADVEANGDGTFSVHLYEIVDNGDGSAHTATSAWYTVNASGIGTDDIFGEEIDLRM